MFVAILFFIICFILIAYSIKLYYIKGKKAFYNAINSLVEDLAMLTFHAP